MLSEFLEQKFPKHSWIVVLLLIAYCFLNFHDTYQSLNLLILKSALERGPSHVHQQEQINSVWSFLLNLFRKFQNLSSQNKVILVPQIE